MFWEQERAREWQAQLCRNNFEPWRVAYDRPDRREVCGHRRGEQIVVVVSKPWMTHARDLFRDKPYQEKLIFCEGGNSRQESLFNACNYLKDEFGKDVGVISHDAARPFLSIRIIEDNIKQLKKGMHATPFFRVPTR